MPVEIWAEPVNRISARQIDELLAIPIAENLHIEYKRQINLDSEQAKAEFIADISAFANSRGGIIFYGISEEAGIPKEIGGVLSENFDGLILTMRQILESTITPRIPHLDLGSIRIGEKSIVAVRVPPSIIGPHMVQYRGSNKFFLRAVGGKRLMDWMEIKESYLQSDRRAQLHAKFRKERIEQLARGEFQNPVSEGPKLVVHMFPHSSANRSRVVEAKRWGEPDSFLLQVPLWEHPVFESDMKLNFDGLLNKCYDRGYLQITYDGVIEGVSAIAVAENTIPMWSLEKTLVTTVDRYRQLLQKVDAGGPFSTYLSLISAKGARYRFQNQYADPTAPLDRDTFMFGDVSVEGDTDLVATLKTVVDHMWNACGYDGSPNQNSTVRR